jgi:hypothetical protein
LPVCSPAKTGPIWSGLRRASVVVRIKELRVMKPKNKQVFLWVFAILFFGLCAGNLFLTTSLFVNEQITPKWYWTVFCSAALLLGGISDSSLVRKGYFVFNGIADTQKNIYSIQSKEYPAIGGWVIIESGIITYNYQQEDAKGYVYARGTCLNDLLTDSILIPSIRMTKYGEALMSGKINMEDLEMAGLLDEMRNKAIMFKKNILSFIYNNI